MQAPAQPAELMIPPNTGDQEAWLVSYAPGELYWQRFGHNAIWIRDPGMGIDHAFNFGYFDFQQERFLANFMQGRMLYFSLAVPSAREFGQYRDENRSIIAQKLNLTPRAFSRLRDYLLQQVRPQNRDYLYDYYLSNCSTRVRDALDLALEGALSRASTELAAAQNYRDHTRRSVAAAYWYYLGLEAALGLPVDGKNSRWEEMFLPAVVAEVISDLRVDGVALVTEEHVMYQADSALPPSAPPPVWWRYMLLSVLAAVLIIASGKSPRPALSDGMVLAWLMLAATGGVVLLALWTLTDHQVASPNANLLLINPFFLLGFWHRFRRMVAMLIMAGLVLASGQLLLPAHQFNLDVLVFVLPMNLLAAWWLWRGNDDSEN
jgi:hypothetical protein